MWLATPIGFFSIVEKPGDRAAGTLTVRARLAADLDALRAGPLPDLGPTEAGGTDYALRARAPRAAVAAALARMVEALDYPNFKEAVAARQGAKRADVYNDAWAAFARLQTLPKPVRPGAARAKSYGGVLLDAAGRVLLFEPAGHSDGYVWTFPKGRPNPGEAPDQTALRKVREETGYDALIKGPLPGLFAGGTGVSAYFVMAPVGLQRPFGQETASVRWVTFRQADAFLRLTRNPVGQARDLAVLAALRAWAKAARDR